MNVKNRKCIRKLSFKSLWASRKRNVVATFAIILTTLMFTSLFTIILSMNSSYQTHNFRQIGGYSHGVYKQITEEQVKAIRGHNKVKSVGERKVIGTISEGAFAKVSAEVSYMDENCAKWSYAKPTKGRMAKSGKEITMDTKALKMLGVEPKLGTKITLTYLVENQKQSMYEKTDTFTLVGYWEYDNLSVVHDINISKEYADEIEREAVTAGFESFRIDLDVMLNSEANISKQMKEIASDLGYSLNKQNEENSISIGVNWGYTSAQLGENMNIQTVLGILAFLFLIILTGYLIIYNIFQISVSGDIRFYGLLKTIGVTPRQLRRIIRQQALILCVIGIPFGLIAGYAVGAWVTPKIIAAEPGMGVFTLSTSPFIFIASAIFAFITVLLSCARPGRMAAKVSPVEASKYTESIQIKRKSRNTRGAKVYQMAFANLGRNKMRTVLVVISMALAVVLLQILVTFVGGLDMEKYMDRKICADFVVSSTDYFCHKPSEQGQYILPDEMAEIKANTKRTTEGCGYTLSRGKAQNWVTEEEWKAKEGVFYSEDSLEKTLAEKEHRGNLVPEDFLMEGLDDALFEKLKVVEGDLNPLFQENTHAIAIIIEENDYGKVRKPEFCPAIGEKITVTYQDNTESHDVDYTVCAYVVVPYSMSYRYDVAGLSGILPVDKMEEDSMATANPLFYLFDTPDAEAEKAAESYLKDLTISDTSTMMYESKASGRMEFKRFRQTYLLMGGLLCAIIGVVGILNFFNAIMTGILSRRREFAVLQSVGMTNKQLKTMLVYEGMFYAMGSVLLALLISIVLNPLVGNLLEKMFWFFRNRFNVLSVIVAVPVFALLGWMIPSMMYGQTMKQSVVERLRENE